MKNPQTYEHVSPAAVGNKRVLPVSSQSGRANVAANLGSDGGTPIAQLSTVTLRLEEEL